MRSIPLNNASIYDHFLIDLKNNIFVTIYKIENRFAFRYISAQNYNEISDPINKSNKYNWAWGPYTSANIAEQESRLYYLTNGYNYLFDEVK